MDQAEVTLSGLHLISACRAFETTFSTEEMYGGRLQRISKYLTSSLNASLMRAKISLSLGRRPIDPKFILQQDTEPKHTARVIVRDKSFTVTA